MRWSLVVVVVVVALVPAGCGDVDRESYTEKNVSLLRTLPTYPGARPVGKVDHSGYKANEHSDAIVGYFSSRTFKLPAGTKAGAAVRYYQRELDDWKVEDISKAPSISLRKGDAYLHVLAGEGEVDLEVDHDCTPGCGGP
jgi:hypothetical protein